MMADVSLVAMYSLAISCVCSKRKLRIEWTVYVSRSQVCDQLYTPMLQTPMCRFSNVTSYDGEIVCDALGLPYSSEDADRENKKLNPDQERIRPKDAWTISKCDILYHKLLHRRDQRCLDQDAIRSGHKTWLVLRFGHPKKGVS